jgi:hypothetical protein
VKQVQETKVAKPVEVVKTVEVAKPVVNAVPEKQELSANQLKVIEIFKSRQQQYIQAV